MQKLLVKVHYKGNEEKPRIFEEVSIAKITPSQYVFLDPFNYNSSFTCNSSNWTKIEISRMEVKGKDFSSGCIYEKK